MLAEVMLKDVAATKGMCEWQSLQSAKKAGDKEGAAAARAALLKLSCRSRVHLVIRSVVMGERST